MLQGVMRSSTIGLLYALKMHPQERSDMEHERCTKTKCNATSQGNPIELENLEPFHSRDCNRDECKEVGPDTQELIETIKKKKKEIPLLRYRPTTGEVELVGNERFLQQRIRNLLPCLDGRIWKQKDQYDEPMCVKHVLLYLH